MMLPNATTVKTE